ncbi:MAG: zinc metallopeptidase [Acholeplasmatales bacterium]|nr:zinc metallopeptidase [Acholeplasmatales bacterium]
MNEIIDAIKESTGATSDILAFAMLVVAGLIVIFTLIGVFISIILFFKYNKLNHTKNSCDMTGLEVARKILDDNDLQHIKVKATGSFIWGNSYSHVWKKVRLRRFTYKKNSVTSLAMAAQKSSLAILDKEHDPIMMKRNKLIPLQMFGPLMFLPLVIIGIVIDLLIASALDKDPNYAVAFTCAGLGVILYAISFALTVVILKAETKAQEKSIEILKKENLANDTEIEQIKGLYKVYNLEYVNNMIIAFLELVLRVLQIIAQFQGKSSSSKD